MRASAATAWIGLAMTLAAASCGGSSSKTGVDGGGAAPSDAGVTDVAAVDEGGSSSLTSFCATIASQVAACPGPTVCQQEEVQYCTTWGPSLSDAARDAVTQCGTALTPCPDGGPPGGGDDPQELSCFYARATAAPTATQLKVKADFCATCPDGAAASAPTSCSGFFDVTVNDAGATDNAGGAFVAILSDALDTMIDQQCVGLPASADGGCSAGFGTGCDCAQAFAQCVAAVFIYDANLPAKCTDGL